MKDLKENKYEIRKINGDFLTGIAAYNIKAAVNIYSHIINGYADILLAEENRCLFNIIKNGKSGETLMAKEVCDEL